MSIEPTPKLTIYGRHAASLVRAIKKLAKKNKKSNPHISTVNKYLQCLYEKAVKEDIQF